MYMLPLIFLLAGAIFGTQLADDIASSDVYAATGGLLGLIAGFMLVKGLSLLRPLASVAQPVILHSD